MRPHHRTFYSDPKYPKYPGPAHPGPGDPSHRAANAGGWAQRARAGVLAAALLAAAPVSAELTWSTDEAFVTRHEALIRAEAKTVFEEIFDIAGWWNGAHSWSADATNLYIEPGAGGCFCERLPGGGGVEHLHIVFYNPPKEIRLVGGLGPLQQMGVNGTMSWRVEQAENAPRKLVFEYRVHGHVEGGLTNIAPAVDAVIGEQHARLLERLGER